jgi:hypothetical protein
LSGISNETNSVTGEKTIMKTIDTDHNRLLGLAFSLILFLSIAQTASAQAEKLGIVSYTPVKGWTKTLKENIVAFSEVDQKAGRFCFITLYGATPGTGNPNDDFKREWNNLVVKPFGAEADPKTETDMADGWTVTAGGATVDFQSGKALAFLTVMSGGGRTVSILGFFNHESYLGKLTAFSSSIDPGAAVAAVTPPRPVYLAPAASEPSSETMHAAALVKEFENNEIRANQQWIGKRVRIHGTINTIEIDKSGDVVLTFKSSITTRNNARCYFRKSASSSVASLTANEEGTVEGIVKGLGDGFEGAKAFLVLKDCIVP